MNVNPERGRPQAQPPYERIKQGILDGTFVPDAPLVESAVAEWCGVSRTPIREALARLEQDGLVERTPRGMIVKQRTPEEILEIYEVRIVLEAMAARIAAERHTSIDRVRLERIVSLEEEGDESQTQVNADRNREFHRSIWLASHNEALIDLLDRLNSRLLRYPGTTLIAPQRWKESLEEHRNLVDAVFARDLARAHKIAEQHFITARDIRLKLWEENIV